MESILGNEALKLGESITIKYQNEVRMIIKDMLLHVYTLFLKVHVKTFTHQDFGTDIISLM